nr:MAG TPA_asm: hypothetical protein [Caudoviricetes sp.]
MIETISLISAILSGFHWRKFDGAFSKFLENPVVHGLHF